MKIDLNNIATALITLNVPAEAQGKLLEAATARALAFDLPVPAEPQEASTYFKGTLEGQVASSIDGLIERFPIDFDATIALVEKIWTLRYNLVHPTSNSHEELLLKACAEKLYRDVDFADPAVGLLTNVIKGGKL